MTRVGTPSAAFLLLAICTGCLQCDDARAATCDALPGQWTWFTQGVVTFERDGRMSHDPGNDGTWTCTDHDEGRVTLEWRLGGYVNHVALSADGRSLASTDPDQQFVTARKLDGPRPVPQTGNIPAAVDAPLVLTMAHEGDEFVPKDLPELMQAATSRAHQWRTDAIPVALEFERREAPNPKLRGPAVRFSFVSPADGTGLFLTVTSAGASAFEVKQPVTWGTLALPPVFLDLPAALRIAHGDGMSAPVRRASLRTWSPPGAPPVLAWMVGDRTVNGASGEIIRFDVTGYIEKYNADWESAARRLRALWHGPRRATSGGEPFSYGSDSGSSDSGAPYDDGSAAREQHERNAAEARAYWSEDPGAYDRVKNGECSWSDSSRYGC
jgi:hypothetical protein